MQAPPTVPWPVGYDGCVGEPSGNGCGSKYVPYLLNTCCGAAEFRMLLFSLASILLPLPLRIWCSTPPPASGRGVRWMSHFWNQTLLSARAAISPWEAAKSGPPNEQKPFCVLLPEYG